MKLFAIILFLSCAVSAHKKSEHREHAIHAHGAGALGIAFEGTKGSIEFKIPSESIFGFEYKAKSDQDKKTRDDALAKLENKISEMLEFDPSLNCKIQKEKIEVVAETSKHSDVVATYSVMCDKSPVGSEVTFNFQKQFPKIKGLGVQFIADNMQKSVEATKNNTKLPLR